jgi:Ser/Thr protein kinase RdoA (MazF antagonist)
VNEALTPALVQRACIEWGIEPERCRLLGDFESFVYEVEVRERPAVLRLTHRSHRSRADIEAELDFVCFLAERALPVCRPVSSTTGSLCFSLAGEFFACCFERAEGSHAKRLEPTLWNDCMLDDWGGTLARFHQSARGYAPLAGRPQRFHWHEDDLTAKRYFSPEDADLSLRLADLLAELGRLPTSPDSYGLIHADLHPRNFFVSEAGALSVFDFDDACQHWFSYDLAVVLDNVSRDTSTLECDRTFDSVLAGYQRVRELPPRFRTELPLLLLLRELQLYQLMHKKRAPADRDQGWHERAAALAQAIRSEAALRVRL